MLKSFGNLASPAPKTFRMSDSKRQAAVLKLALRYTLPVTVRKPSPEYDDLKARMASFLKDHFSAYIWQAELPTPTNLHFQISAQVNRRRRPWELLNLLKEEFKDQNQPSTMFYCEPSSKAGVEALRNYCMKPDTRYDGPWADRIIYTGADVKEPGLRPWQAAVSESLAKTPDDRTVNWVVDTHGNSGKSWLCKRMFVTKQAHVLTYCGHRDMIHNISNNRDKPAYFFDLSRTKPHEFKIDDLIQVIEQLKNGLLTNSKYNCESWAQATAHVWIFANFKPDTAGLSADRWRFHRINSTAELIRLPSLPPSRVLPS